MLTDETGERPAPWQWPGLWSLNLPFLLLLWQILFAETFRIWLSGYHFATVPALAWLFVAAERAIFFFRLRNRALDQEARKKADEERAAMVRISTLIVVGLILIGFFRANLRELAGVLIWTSVGGMYLLGLRLKPAETNEFLPREMALSIYLAGLILLFIWANMAWLPVEAVLPGLLFLLLLFYYFCLIASWAKPYVPAPSTGSLFASDIRILYRVIPLSMILVGVILALVNSAVAPDRLLLTIGVSGLLLLLLDVWQASLNRSAARLFADLALMVPLIPLLVGL